MKEEKERCESGYHSYSTAEDYTACPACGAKQYWLASQGGKENEEIFR